MADDELSRNQKEIEQQERKACAKLRAAVLEGYQDILAGRVYKFEGNLQAMLDEAQKRGGLKKKPVPDPADRQISEGIKDAVFDGPSLDGVDLDRDQSPMRDADF
ncbi:MAG: hypothetical protein JKX70_03025 [Phycisphaerales bacterium]|nr:hypothetical protein [Phycisphaerales bacterium]